MTTTENQVPTRAIAFVSGDAVDEEVRRQLEAERGLSFYRIDDENDRPGRHRYPVLFVLDAPFVRAHSENGLYEQMKTLTTAESPAVVITQLDGDQVDFNLPEESVFSLTPRTAGRRQVSNIILRAMEAVSLAQRAKRLETDLQELNAIGASLSAERDVDSLLGAIVAKSRDITAADAGSLYVVEYDEHDNRRLRFKLSQNDSLDLSYEEFTMEISKNSAAGYVALTGEILRLDDVYDLPPDAPFGFNRSFDEATGYRTKSMLVAPMKNTQGEILGVIQLINRQRNPEVRLTSPEVVEREVIPFTAYSEDLVGSLASQAAVALHNSVLYTQLEEMFEGFVRAAVTAVELRDPATSGHSQRVTTLTLGLAKAVSESDHERFRDIHYDEVRLRELRFSGLLHDFGKIGVRENVLVKAKKLYEERLQLVQERFDFAKRTTEAEAQRRKLELIDEVDDPAELQRRFIEIDEHVTARIDRLTEYFNVILTANEPTVLDSDAVARLTEIAAETYTEITGDEEHLLSEDELQALSIRRGSLDDAERKEIQSHVTHSFRFLTEIPWPRDLRMVAEIAYGHHELLDGSGYPRGLTEEEILFDSKMMTIADIFDALTAADRPYKKAMPVEQALHILDLECKDGHLDPDLLELFKQEKVFNLVLPPERRL